MNQEADFERIWELYPSKRGKKAAQRHFRASVKTDKDLADIQTALKHYSVSQRVKNGYIQDGSTWFNNW